MKCVCVPPCSALGDKIYLHGGAENENATVCAEGLYQFTPGTNRIGMARRIMVSSVSIASAVWEQIKCTGSPPTAQSSSMVVHEKSLIVFGGIVSGKAQNSVHSLNLGKFWLVNAN